MFKKVYSLYSAFYPSLRFTLSLQSAFYTQSAFYPWSAVCVQSAVRLGTGSGLANAQPSGLTRAQLELTDALA